MWLWKGDIATRTRDPGRGGAVGGGFIGGINGATGHGSIAVVEGAIVEFAIPVVLEDVCGTELVPESENAVRTRLSGIKVVLRAFKRGELFDGKVFRELFDREVGKIVRHLMHFLSVDRTPFNSSGCSLFMDW